VILDGVQDGTSESFASPLLSDEVAHWTEKHSEGKLAVDVAHDDKPIFVVSTMAGAETDKIEVYVHNDLLTIRGTRKSPFEDTDNVEFYYKECFWGVFSRTIVLPTDVKGDLAHAKYENGILTVKIPKQKTDTKITVEIVDE